MQDEFRMLEEMLNYENKFNSMKFKQILTDLRSNDDIRILDAVSRLSAELSLAEEITLGGFNLDSLVPELLNCLTKDGIPDIMVHAGAALTHILDILPTTASVIVNNDGVSILCDKLQYFEYSDVAENSIKALEKISIEYGDFIIKAGGFTILINTIDFFIQNIQKSIINILRNCISFISNEDALKNEIIPNLPSLISYLKNDETKSDIFCEVFSKLSDKIGRLVGDDFEKKKKYLESIINDEIIEKLFIILNEINKEDFIKDFQKSCTKVEDGLKILSKVCFCSSKITLFCFKLGLIKNIDKFLNIYQGFLGSKENSQYNNFLYEIVILINSVISIRSEPFPFIGQLAKLVGIKIMENPKVNEKLELLEQNRDLYTSMVCSFFPLLPPIYELNSGNFLKYLILILIEKIFFYSSKKELQLFLQNFDLASFLSKLINSNDILKIAFFLLICEKAISKLSDVVVVSFMREGILAFVEGLQNEENLKKLEVLPLNRETVRGKVEEEEIAAVGGEEEGEKNDPTNILEQILKNEFLMSSLRKDSKVEGEQSNESLRCLELLNKLKSTKEKIKKSTEILNKSKKKPSQSSAQNNNQLIEVHQEMAKIAKNIIDMTKNQSKNNLEVISDVSNTLNTVIVMLKSGMTPSFNYEEDFGLNAFQLFTKLLQKYKRITLYELNNSQIVRTLLDFLLDKSLKRTESKEEVKSNEDLALKIKLENKQVTTILKRIVVFARCFAENSPVKPNETVLDDFWNNLQNSFTESSNLSKKLDVNDVNSDIFLLQDLRNLSQRCRFKARFIQGDEEKNISASIEDLEKLESKKKVFKEVPVLMLSVEQFGTFEVIEDYLLNKFNGKEDINPFTQKKFYPPSFERPKMMINDENQEDLDFFTKSIDDEQEDINPKISNEPFNSSPIKKKLELEHSLKKTQSSKISIDNKFGGSPTKTLEKKKSEGKIEIKKSTNLKKVLEITFYHNGKEIDKTSTIFEIFGGNIENMRFEFEHTLIIDYKISLKSKKSQKYTEKNEIHAIQNSFCSTAKQSLNNLIQKIADIEDFSSKIKETEKSLIPVIQLIVLLSEIKGLLVLFSSTKSIFYPEIISLKETDCTKEILNEITQNKILQLFGRKDATNHKISEYLLKKFSDPIVVTSKSIDQLFRLIVNKASFLLDYQARLSYFKYFTFDVTRSLFYMCQNLKNKYKELSSLKIGKLNKKKVKVARENLLESGYINFESYGRKKHILEFEFINEEGTGLGPTLEYFSILGSELRKMKGYWRKTDDDSLFPAPIDYLKLKSKELHSLQFNFRLMGMLVARAIIDERILDFPLNALFWDLILERPVFLEDLRKMDSSLGSTIISFQELLNKKKEIESDRNLVASQKKEQIKRITLNGATIESLNITFVLPGADHIELIEKGESKTINMDNMKEYIEGFSKIFFHQTIKLQLDSFREGFCHVFDIKNLSVLESNEIENLYCGEMKKEYWEKNDLLENVVANYGYSNKNQAFINFIEILSEFNNDERKTFLRFCTGCPRLPSGGFKNLSPKLTVVKKTPNYSNQTADHILPSVMTCQNYVKLPEYSSKEMMRNRLKYAMSEGQNEFALS